MSAKNSTILMVPPHGFQFNAQTALSNTFQSATPVYNASKQALDEFNQMTARLKAEGLRVLILEQDNNLPDAVFPNNWFSTHLDDEGKCTLIIYPMLTPNRQAEVNIPELINVFSDANIEINEIIDLRNNDNEILEGTGSLVLDRDNRLIYASLSARTSATLVDKVADILNYQLIIFNSVDEQCNPIYHTNVILSITKNLAIICLESIKDVMQRELLLQSFNLSNKLVISITYEQVNHMCGNVLELFNNKGDSLLILSGQAKQYFSNEQLNLIQQFSQLIAVDVQTIETIGGGSARCMMAEVYT